MSTVSKGYGPFVRPPAGTTSLQHTDPLKLLDLSEAHCEGKEPTGDRKLGPEACRRREKRSNTLGRLPAPGRVAYNREPHHPGWTVLEALDPEKSASTGSEETSNRPPRPISRRWPPGPFWRRKCDLISHRKRDQSGARSAPSRKCPEASSKGPKWPPPPARPATHSPSGQDASPSFRFHSHLGSLEPTAVSPPERTVTEAHLGPVAERPRSGERRGSREDTTRPSALERRHGLFPACPARTRLPPLRAELLRSRRRLAALPPLRGERLRSPPRPAPPSRHAPRRKTGRPRCRQ